MAAEAEAAVAGAEVAGPSLLPPTQTIKAFDPGLRAALTVGTYSAFPERSWDITCGW